MKKPEIWIALLAGISLGAVWERAPAQPNRPERPSAEVQTPLRLVHSVYFSLNDNSKPEAAELVKECREKFDQAARCRDVRLW